MITPITVGIVGLGRAGWYLHLEPIKDIGGFKIVSVADPAQERRAEAMESTGCQGFESLDELLAGSDAEVVVIATPSSLHYSDAMKVLHAGRHCVLEKPIAMNYAEAEEIVALAEAKGLKLFVYHPYLHQPEYYHFRKVIERGVLGPIFNIRILRGGYARRWDWQTLQKNGGGQLNNAGPHYLTLLLPLLGSPVVEVFSDLRNIKNAGDAEDHVHVVLRTEDGTTGDLTVSSALAGSTGPLYSINGRYGALTSDGRKSFLRYYDPAKVPVREVIDAAAPGRAYLDEDLPWVEEELVVEPCPVPPFHDNIYDVLRAGADQVVTPESAAEVVRVIEMAYHAANRQSGVNRLQMVSVE